MVASIIRFVTKVCVQTAIYWGSPISDGEGGFTYADPIEIKVRWDGKTHLIRANNGEEVTSQAEIMVLQDIDLDGYLLLDSLVNLDSDSYDDPIACGAYKVLVYEKAPLFKSTDEFVRTVWL